MRSKGQYTQEEALSALLRQPVSGAGRYLRSALVRFSSLPLTAQATPSSDDHDWARDAIQGEREPMVQARAGSLTARQGAGRRS